MNVLSLFSGIGGLDLGLQRAGMTITGQVEIDPWCRQILARHWPEVPRHDDVRTTLEWWGDRPRPDLVCGGFPCQPVSLAGKGLAQADPRWLWPAMAHIIRWIRPRYALMENVPGLLGRGMGEVLGDLAACGYDAEWDCIPASAVGANHQRDRVWIVAYPQRHTREACRPRDTSEGPRGRDASRSAIGAHVADTASSRHTPRPRGTSRQIRLEAWRPRPDGLGSTLADTNREPLGWPAITRPERHHWAAEPDVGRVAHGIPARVDRLRSLGNAVVPQVAEHIGRMILEAA